MISDAKSWWHSRHAGDTGVLLVNPSWSGPTEQEQVDDAGFRNPVRGFWRRSLEKNQRAPFKIEWWKRGFHRVGLRRKHKWRWSCSADLFTGNSSYQKFVRVVMGGLEFQLMRSDKIQWLRSKCINECVLVQTNECVLNIHLHQRTFVDVLLTHSSNFTRSDKFKLKFHIFSQGRSLHNKCHFLEWGAHGVGEGRAGRRLTWWKLDIPAYINFGWSRVVLPLQQLSFTKRRKLELTWFVCFNTMISGTTQYTCDTCSQCLSQSQSK